MIIDLAMQREIPIFREPHVPRILVLTQAGQPLHQQQSRSVDGSAAYGKAADFTSHGCCRIPCRHVPGTESGGLRTTRLPEVASGELQRFMYYYGERQIRVYIEPRQIAIGIRSADGRSSLAMFGVEQWAEEEPEPLKWLADEQDAHYRPPSEPAEQEGPYHQDLSTADGAVIAAQRALRAAEGDTNLRIELEGLGWTIVPKISVVLDLNSLNEIQLNSIRRLAERYPHGWHNADLKVRKDAKEEWYEADWLRTIAQQIAKQTR